MKESTSGRKETDNIHSGHRQRLRKAYIEQGADGLYEHQLLELLLTFALPRVDTNALAHELLKKENFGSLAGVLRADVHELAKVQGIGESAAVLLSLAGALARKADAERMRGEKLATPDAAIRYCQTLANDTNNERMYVISLDGGRRVLHADAISSGIPGETIVYPRTVVECAIRYGAVNIILCHNHPSGDVTPSLEDCETTKKIIGALSPIGITLNDHIIVGGGNAFSMARGSELISGAQNDTQALAAERKK